MKNFLTWLHEEEQKVDVYSQHYIPYLQQQEGWRASRYKDTAGHPTVGHGFLIDDSFDETLKQNFPDKPESWRQGIISGSGEMTPEEGKTVLSSLGRQKFDQARSMVGEQRFDAMSPELQTYIASENYRGMLGKSPKALNLIRSGDYVGASKEYLNAKEFRENQNNSRGLRMKDLADTLAKQPPWTPPEPPKQDQ